jgi:hypothetical protein
MAMAGPGSVADTESGTVSGTVSGTAPYPWPWDGRFSPRRCALLVVGDRSPIGDASVDAALRELTSGALEAGVMAIGVITGRLVRRGGLGLARRPVGNRRRVGRVLRQPA